MSDDLIADPSGLEKKDKSQLAAIVQALGGQAKAKDTKADLIKEIERLSAQELDEEEDTDEESSEPEEQEVAEQPEEGNARSRRKGRSRTSRAEAGNDPVSDDLQNVDGFLDLRDEGYGFLRVNGFLPSKHDVYVSVKQVRSLELRKGDHLAGKATPAHRNEKNPSFASIDVVNGSLPDDAMKRPLFEELTSGYPTQQIRLESDDNNPFNRVVDLVAPIGKGQRCFLSGPSRSGRTEAVAGIAKAVEQNYSEMSVLILSIDSRPEEVNYLRGELNAGEVIASTFDRPAEEHIATAELTLERSKRMAEKGEDVFIVIDSLTQLAKAYISSFIQSTRSSAANIELPALAPVKALLGGAANLEEAGSVTVVAVVNDSVLDSSYLDAIIYSELRSTANSEIVLTDVMGGEPVVDITASGTAMEQLMLDESVVVDLLNMRKIVAEADQSTHGNGPLAIEQLTELLAGPKSNSEILTQIVKQGSLPK